MGGWEENVIFFSKNLYYRIKSPSNQMLVFHHPNVFALPTPKKEMKWVKLRL